MAIKQIVFGVLALIMTRQACFSQSGIVFGTIKESETGEAVSGAYILEENSRATAISNRHGYYNLKVSLPAKITLVVSHLGYLTKPVSTTVTNDTLINITVDPGFNELSEVVVTAPLRDRNPISTVSIPVKRLKKIPMVLGEPDLFKALAFLPGVTTGVEGTSGLHVRGGTPDQNLILLDDTPVYNPHHLFGLFSVFHPEMVKDIQLIKGGFPSRYGGRLSSVIDVRMKDGNKNNFEGEASLGLINSRLSLEGPLGNGGNTSYHIGGRISYVGALMKPVFSLVGSGERISYVMHDWNAKLHHVINDKNEFSFSYYFGRDNYELIEGDRWDYDSFGLHWGNQTATVRYKKIFGPDLFANFTAWYTEYRHGIGNESVFEDEGGDLGKDFFRSGSGLRDYSTKADFEWLPHHSHEVNFGAELNFHRYRQGDFRSSFVPDTVSTGSGFRRAAEFALYLEDSWSASGKVDISLGARMSAFTIRTTTYSAVEPRISSSWEIVDNTSIRASYAAMRQYIHMLASSGVGLPNDIWVPSTASIPPQDSRQWTLGMVRELPSSNVKMTVEGFYKTSDNLVEPLPGTNYLLVRDENWERSVYSGGTGRIWGLETMVEMRKGEFEGWVSYTHQKNMRKFENINKGRWFPARYDRRHNVSLVGSYTISEKWDVNWTWTYSSGQAVTVPVAVVKTSEGIFIPVFSERNNNRMPDFHRFDAGANYKWKSRKRQRHKQLSLGIYNLYNRVNPLYLDYDVPSRAFDRFGNNLEMQVIRRGGIPILPYFNYIVKL